MSDIAVGDSIHHIAVPPGVLDVTVEEIKPCEGDGEPGDHPSFLIADPETGEPDSKTGRQAKRSTQHPPRTG